MAEKTAPAQGWTVGKHWLQQVTDLNLVKDEVFRLEQRFDALRDAISDERTRLEKVICEGETQNIRLQAVSSIASLERITEDANNLKIDNELST